MRRAGVAGILVLIVAVAAGFRTAGASQPTAASVVKALDRVEAKYASQLLGMCVGAVDQGVSIAKCYGKKGPGSTARAGVDTIFAVDSVTKTFAATLLAVRVQQGSVALADPVDEYVPVLGGRSIYPSSPAVTLQELADHYSGLPKQAPKSKNVDDFLIQTGTCLRKTSCRVKLPGTRYFYSNWAFAALGDVLGLHDGFSDGPLGPWAPDNAQAITGPLGMTATKTWSDWKASVPGYFDSHRATAEGDSLLDHFGSSPEGDPGGGLFSTARDMLKWLRFSMGLSGPAGLLAAHHLLYEDTATVPTNNRDEKVGLAWEVNTSTGWACVWKGGDGLGFHAYVLFLEGRKRGIFLLLNNSPTTNKATIGKALLNSLPPIPGIETAKC